MDQVEYTDTAPWPEGADGFGLSLQRRDPGGFGNEPTNWVAAPPTAGAGRAPADASALRITAQPQSLTALAGTAAQLAVALTGGPARCLWRCNGQPVAGATNLALDFAALSPADAGEYQAVVYTESQSVVSTRALVTVLSPPAILVPPQGMMVRPGSNVTFGVLAFGQPPVRYQWFLNAAPISRATNSA